MQRVKTATSSLLTIAATVLLLLLVLVAPPLPAHAWWCSGHMLTAQIALNNVDPNVRDITNAYFKYLSDIGPFDRAADAVNGACWADDVKGYGMKAMNEWHFIDTPYDPTSFPYTGCPVQNANVASLMGSFGGLVSAAKRSNQKDWVAALALAYVVHMFGDIHQPLHAVTYFSSEFPDGDRGGNSIHLQWNGEATNLHSFWDSICKQPSVQDPPRPLNSTGEAWIHQYAKYLNDTYGVNVTEEQAALHDYEEIANESYQLAKNAVYANGSNIIGSTGDVIPEWYRDRCIKTAERQVLLGGLRLARTLTYMFEGRTMPAGIQRIIDGNAKAGGDEAFGGKEAGIFFGGFGAALLIVALVFVIWKHVYGGEHGGAAARHAPKSNSSLLSPKEEAAGGYTNIREAASV